MTFYSDLLTAVEAKIEAEYTATLANVGDAVPFDLSLPELLRIRDYLKTVTLSGGVVVDNVAVTSSALPTGASTSALQTTGNTSLGNIDTKLPASLGIQTSANSFSITPASDAVFNVSGNQISYTESALTAAGTASPSRSKLGYPSISISYTVALNGSTSVTVRTEVSNDGTNWLNANLAGVNTTQTTSGTFGFVGTNPYQFVRFLFVSEAGGTGATITPIITLGQGYDAGTGLVTNLPSTLGLKIPSQSLSVVQAYPDLLPFSTICFERTVGTFGDNTSFHDCCEFLTSGQLAFTQVTTADALELISTSASDAAAGTGSRTVGVIYLDASGVWSQTVVTLNGTTAVPLTGITASAIISMSVLTGGSSPVSAGTITLRKVGVPTTIYEQITAGGNQSKSGRFTCPTGYFALIDDINLSAFGQSIEFALRSNRNHFDGSTTGDRYLFKGAITLASSTSMLSLAETRLDAGQTIKMSGIAAATAGNPRVNGFINLRVIAL